MPFQVSPGVNVSEIDLTTVVPAVSSTEGAIAGVFKWGPVEQRVLVDSESNLAARFGKPSNLNAETFLTAANFLSYGNKLYVVRAADVTPTYADGEDGTSEYITAALAANASIFVANTGALTAVAPTGALTAADIQQAVVKNKVDFDRKVDLGDFADISATYVARFPGELGNSLKISVCDSADAFGQTIVLNDPTGTANTATQEQTTTSFTIAVGSNTGVVAAANTASGTLANANSVVADVRSALSIGDVIAVGGQKMHIASISAVKDSTTTRYIEIGFDEVLQTAAGVTATSIAREWEFAAAVEAAPGQSQYVAEFGNTAAQDELHVVVVDEGGKFTGVPGTILEVFQGLSRATDAKSADGAGLFYKEVINLSSNYVYCVNDRAGAASAPAATVASSENGAAETIRFVGGLDGADESAIAITSLAAGYDLFASAEEVDISLVLQGKARGTSDDNYGQLANYIIDNICESRKDCVAFVSPDRADVVSNAGSETDSVVAYRNSLRSTSYAVLDSGYKYQYDKYNDVYRWIPLNGDTAGLCVRTDNLRDPWWSPAGFNRGQIKNIVKLAYNPSKAHRDILYKAGVNPVVTFPGEGTILYGDKTLLAKPSAFDRINVRRLFIVLEKAIATAAKYTLFEFNDDFTRSQFRNLVEPFLRDVQGRRGIYDYKVVCDTTNNTGEVIDRNEFVGDIYIKPAKSINFIQLNFVAVRTGVEFSEVVGKF